MGATGIPVAKFELSDNGDDDGFADSNETVRLTLTATGSPGS